MAAKTTLQSGEDLLTVWTSLFLGLPLAGVSWATGVGKEQDVVETVWKGYDAWGRLASASIDTLYRTPLFGESMVRALEGMLHWQRLSNALAGASFAGLWPTLGLPTAAAVHDVSAEVQTLRTAFSAFASDMLLSKPLQEDGTRIPPPFVLPSKEPPSSSTDPPVLSKKSTNFTTDVGDYFEPVSGDARVAPDPALSEGCVPNLGDYFEPVAYDVQAAPGPEQSESRASTKKDGQTKAVLTGIPSVDFLQAADALQDEIQALYQVLRHDRDKAARKAAIARVRKALHQAEALADELGTEPAVSLQPPPRRTGRRTTNL